MPLCLPLCRIIEEIRGNLPENSIGHVSCSVPYDTAAGTPAEILEGLPSLDHESVFTGGVNGRHGVRVKSGTYIYI